MAPSAGGAFDPHNSYTWTGTQDFYGATIVPATTSPGGATGTVQYPMGTGAGCDILAITAEVAPKQGAPKLAAGQKA